MSNAALYVARTGLDSQSERMRVIANNLANVNTTGFKRDRAEFKTLSYQTVTCTGRAVVGREPLCRRPVARHRRADVGHGPRQHAGRADHHRQPARHGGRG
jgi:flagellar hook-basal body protein